MNKICTTLEQSRKLVELGIDISTADMIYYWFGDFELNDEWYELHLGTNRVNDKDIPAWSLVVLEKLMPFQIIKNNKRFGFYQVKGFNKQGETYRFGYKTNDNSFLFETSWHNDTIDAAFEMICWLKENGKL